VAVEKEPLWLLCAARCSGRRRRLLFATLVVKKPEEEASLLNSSRGREVRGDGRMLFCLVECCVERKVCVLRQNCINSYDNIGNARYQLRSRESFSFLASRGGERSEREFSPALRGGFAQSTVPLCQ
jgi:hypothetical protein